jgi:RNA-directed DNA polymerase
VLGAIYETDFKDFSYGFRPKRSQHDALDAVTVGIERVRVNWVLDMDIKSFFDRIDHGWMIKMIERRIADERVVRHIRKWLSAGVMEDGEVATAKSGTPQGGSISPLLANIYLHYTLDIWSGRFREDKATGDTLIVRYADDVVCGFERRDDAERYRTEVSARLAEFGLELSEEKTRLIEFGRNAALTRSRRGQGKPETFDFLGFTHICGKTRKGKFAVLRKTKRKKVQAKLLEIRKELKRRMHDSVAKTGAWLKSVLWGHYNYYGVPRNMRAMRNFREQVRWDWKRALSRRSQNGTITWDRMLRLSDRWLPKPTITHPYPNQRVCVKTQGRSPVR